MRSLLAHLTKLASNSYVVNTFIVLIIAGGYGFLLVSEVPGKEQSICLFRNLTGIPCPGCGMGRSTWCFVRGQFVDSLYWHPLGILFNGFLLVSLFWCIRDIAKKENSLLRFLKQKWPNVLIWALMVVLVLVWIRNIVLDI